MTNIQQGANVSVSSRLHISEHVLHEESVTVSIELREKTEG